MEYIIREHKGNPLHAMKRKGTQYIILSKRNCCYKNYTVQLRSLAKNSKANYNY